jgi:hypothetical protein
MRWRRQVCYQIGHASRRLSLPGTVVVFTGILPVAKDEQGLAAILGHGMFPLATRDLECTLTPHLKR